MSVDAQARFRYTQQAYGTNMPVQAPPPTMSSQRFCLRWNNHQSNLLSVFDQLLHDESFVDVTLAVEGQLLRAHKMVLSACSPYFQALFVSHPDKHPIVILKDVPYADMRSLLDFMYRGEVSVDQDRLTAFLRVAESLRIKGLTEVNEDKGDLPSITSLLGVNNLNNIQNSNRMTQQQQQQQQAAKRSSGTGQMMSPSLLGNALAQPKRKRGRPRKLSGSSNGSGNDMKSETDLDGEDGPDDDIADDIVKEEPQEQPTAGTSREQENYTNNDYQPEISIRNTNQKLILPKIEPNLSPPLNQNYNRQITNTINRQPTPISAEQMANYQITINQTMSIASPATTDNLNNNNNNNPSSVVTTQSQMAATTSGIPLMAPTSTGRQPPKRRIRRRATSASQDPAEQLTEMSVRGLNLFRYASVSEGVYQCTECAKADVQKTFKNKYSFQRHAFLYHEGHQRKVFPCPVCSKEFSRPDKMKNHMKTVHDCFMPKEIVYPQTNFYFTP